MGEPALVRGGDEGARGEGDEAGAGFAGLGFKAIPSVLGDLAEFAFASEMEVEDDDGEITVAEEEVGALDGLLDFGAANPEELAALFITVGGGIEAVLAVDEGDGEVLLFRDEGFKQEGDS